MSRSSRKCSRIISRFYAYLEIWESTISSPKFGTSIVSTAYGAYLDPAYAQNLAKPPFMRICREFENWRNLRALSGMFLQQKFCCPESFCFFWLWLHGYMTSLYRKYKKMLILLYYVVSGVLSLRSIQFSDQMASESSKIESRLNDWPLIFYLLFLYLVAVNIRT